MIVLKSKLSLVLIFLCLVLETHGSGNPPRLSVRCHDRSLVQISGLAPAILTLFIKFCPFSIVIPSVIKLIILPVLRSLLPVRFYEIISSVVLLCLMLFSFAMFEHGSGVTQTRLSDSGLSGLMSLTLLS